MCLGIFMLLLDITIGSVALPDIQRGLGSSFSGLQWIVDVYALTLAGFLLTAGSLSDMYGRRLLFLIGPAVFTGASLLCGFATSTLMLQVCRPANARHADLPTTMRQDRARQNLDRHPNYIRAAYMASCT